jgi:hypothetical protein
MDEMTQVCRRDPRAPRIMIGEIAAAYWSWLIRRSEPQYLPIWREYLIACVEYGIRTAEMMAEFDTEFDIKTKPTKKRR